MIMFTFYFNISILTIVFNVKFCVVGSYLVLWFTLECLGNDINVFF